MILSLHTIKPAKGSTKKRKRIGRGNASGTGTYSGRGLKGQRSRAGVSNLKRLGMKSMILQIPKKRGFKSFKPKNIPVNIDDLNKFFKDGENINPRTLVKKGLVDTISQPIKILGRGELMVKNLIFENVKISESVVKKINKMDGKITNPKNV